MKNFFHHYGYTLREQARDLRKNPTDPERKLWFCCLKEIKPRFHFQKIIGPYILDFYCPELKIGIELDGESHGEQVAFDADRTAYLSSQGVEIVRYTNEDIMQRFDAVKEHLYQIIQEKGGSNAPQTRAPSPGGSEQSERGLYRQQIFPNHAPALSTTNPPVGSADHPPVEGGREGVLPLGKKGGRGVRQSNAAQSAASRAPSPGGSERSERGLYRQQIFPNNATAQSSTNPPSGFASHPPVEGGREGRPRRIEGREKEPHMKTVTIYTDGACSGNPGPGGWGAILCCDGVEKELSGGEASTTNNRMELTAVISALRALKFPCVVELYSDSKYVIDALQKGWVWGWKKKGWIKSDKKPALNVDLWQELLPLIKTHEVHYHWVKGHAENEKNNRCDQLAVGESRKF